jgi:hypothetical protein
VFGGVWFFRFVDMPFLEQPPAVVRTAEVDLSQTDPLAAGNLPGQQRSSIFEKLRDKFQQQQAPSQKVDTTNEVVTRAAQRADLLLQTVDSTGQSRRERSLLVAAILAADVYHDKAGGLPLPHGIERLDGASFAKAVGGYIQEGDLIDEKSGYFGALYYDSHERTFIYVNRGTNDGPDWITDLKQAPGLQTDQYDGAIELAAKLSELMSYKGDRLVFVGHSLGGGLATAQSKATGLPALVFNPAGVNKDTLERNEAGLDRPSNIVSFVVKGEILTKLQAQANGAFGIFGDRLVPEASGQIVELDPRKDFSLNPFKEATERHRMLAVIEALLP